MIILQILSILLERKSYVKYLGIVVDSNLSWKHHIEYICLKISRTLGILSKVRHFIPRHILEQLYQSLIRPYLNFGICVWGKANDTNFKKNIFFFKNEPYAHDIHFAKYAEATQFLLFLKSNILPIKFLFFEHLASVMYDVSNKLVPDNVLNLFTKISDIHNYSTRAVTSRNFYLKYSDLRGCLHVGLALPRGLDFTSRLHGEN